MHTYTRIHIRIHIHINTLTPLLSSGGADQSLSRALASRGTRSVLQRITADMADIRLSGVPAITAASAVCCYGKVNQSIVSIIL